MCSFTAFQKGFFTNMKTLEKIINGDHGNFIAPFLWLHNEDDTLIVNELRRIHSCGIGAVCIESRTHQEFCRDDWWSDVRLILDTCKELGMKLWILDDKHFPSGYANGIYEKEENRHLRASCIRCRRIDVAGEIKNCSVLADQWKELPDDTFIGAVAFRRTRDGSSFDGQFIDLSESYACGRYYFDLPKGEWSVMLLIRSQADLPAHNRFYGNKLCPEATDAYIEEVYEGHYKRFAEDFGDTLLGFFSDEPQFHNYNSRSCKIVPTGDAFSGYPWHDSLISDLKELYGENAVAMLCRLWYDFSDGSHMSVRRDYMDIISKRFGRYYTDRIGKWCHDHGVMYIGHIIEDNGAHRCTGYGPAHYFRALGGQHMSGIDVVLHQLLPGLCEVANTGYVSYREIDNKHSHYILGKLGSSAAHIDKKKNGRAMCEIFGAFGWAEDLELMKYLADHFLVRGINYYVPHAFSPKENDTDCPPNFYNTGKNPQFKYFGALMSYINRICTFTEGAVHIPCCAVVYDAEMSWSGASFTDNKDICKALYDAQLDYDIIPFDCLDGIDENGCINGERYPVILLPYSQYYGEQELEKLKGVRNRVIVVGGKGDNGYESVSLEELVGYMERYRDVFVRGATKYLRYIHYKREGCSFLMFSNEGTERCDVSVSVKGFEGGEYTLWDAYENKAVRRYSEDGSIALSACPNNLTVVILGSSPEIQQGELASELALPNDRLDAAWSVEICPEREMPNFKPYKTLCELVNICAPDQLPCFTGNIRYTAKVTLDAKKNKIMDLGCVGSTAQVWINGKEVGIRTFAPYRFDISGAVKDGENTVEIIVTNTCVSEQSDGFSKYMAIKPSGLLGPVTV